MYNILFKSGRNFFKKNVEKKYTDARGMVYNFNYIKSYIKDKELLDFILGCLNPDKYKRYNINQLYYHPFLKTLYEKYDDE